MLHSPAKKGLLRRRNPNFGTDLVQTTRLQAVEQCQPARSARKNRKSSRGPLEGFGTSGIRLCREHTGHRSMARV